METFLERDCTTNALRTGDTVGDCGGVILPSRSGDQPGVRAEVNPNIADCKNCILKTMKLCSEAIDSN